MKTVFGVVMMLALAGLANAGDEQDRLEKVAKDAAASFELAKRAAFEVAYRPDKVVPLVKPSNGTVTLIDYRDGSARLTVYDLLPSPSLAPFGAAAVGK